VIRVQKLYKAFGDQPVLRGLDLDVATAEIMVIIGRSGGGKSVLLKHLIGLLRPDSGAILVDGTDITRLRGAALDEIRRRYGVVFQGGALFDSMSVADNVAFPLREKTRLSAAEIKSRVEEKLEQVGLTGMGDKNPAEISGDREGPRQRARGRLLRRADDGPRPHSRQHHPPPDPGAAPKIPLHGRHGQPRDPGDLQHRRSRGHAA
jgi:phospholipid/cholesterol/gamma-HCH transport system ATP-binding protein